MSKANPFAALAAQVTEGFKVKLIDPVTAAPIVDNAGKEAFIEVLSTDSDVGRDFDREKTKQNNRMAAAGRSEELMDEDVAAVNIARIAKLTRTWYLVDPASREEIAVPCNESNALDLYSNPATRWVFRQAFLGASNTANFMKRSPQA